MAYISGSAASFADLKTAIENGCVSNGWTLSSGILSKDSCFFQLVAGTQNGYDQLQLFGGTGQTGTTLNGQPPSNYGAKICSNLNHVIVFPLNYEIHLFANPNEVYCVINYNSDYYQVLSFGKSDVPGIGGTGTWFCGTRRSDIALNGAAGANMSISAGWPNVLSGGGGDTYYAPGLFFDSYSSTGGCSFVHTGLDSTPWRGSSSGTADGSGYIEATWAISDLMFRLPNLYNEATILLPIKPLARRASGGLTIIANLKNARYLRNDNLAPGEIITLGADQWKTYPFFRKDITLRNSGGDYSHSGTFGYAIKYTGT